MSTTPDPRCPRKAVIVAAGMGRRLRPYTDDMPKCLVPVCGRPILLWQLDALRANGITEVVVVRGYRGDVLEARRSELGPGVKFVDNLDYRRNNILQSLFKAEAELDQPLVFSYADIVFRPEVVASLLASPGDISLVVDRGYADAYRGRTLHPLSEAELCAVSAAGLVTALGKGAVPVEKAYGEFIGLAKLSQTGVDALTESWRSLDKELSARPATPFVRATSWENAFLTDLLQHLIDHGAAVSPVPIHGCWREIDTVEDLTLAERMLAW
ncbi:MAG: phosphocholine cytidylyltransferase family protein [Pseudomonadota bacterium]